MKARNVRERVMQTEHWLRENFPTPYPVEVRWVAKIEAAPGADAEAKRMGDFGYCYWRKPNVVIELSRRLCRPVHNLASSAPLHAENGHCQINWALAG